MIDKRAHERLDLVEAAMEQHRIDHKRFEASIAENTVLTRSIEANTSELVTLFKGASSVRTFFVWASPIAAFAIGVWSFINYIIRK